jgi:hypothetical protein
VVASNGLYLGLLCPNEDFRVYGYVTATNVKFIAVIETDVTDQAMRNV